MAKNPSENISVTIDSNLMDTEIQELKKRIERLEAALLSRSPVDDTIPTEAEARMALRDNDIGPALRMIRARRGQPWTA